MRPIHRVLGILTLLLGVGAAFAGRSAPAVVGQIDVAKLSRMVAREDDHVTAIELAAWIKARKPGLRVVDLRGSTEFEALHIPTAERLAIDSLTPSPFQPRETIVLYSEGGAHSAQAWVFLRALGHEQVYFLRGGLVEWVEDILFPTLPTDATDAERARFERAAELSRYFGGTPRTDVPRGQKTAPATEKRRRGC